MTFVNKYFHNNNWYCAYCGCNLSFNQCWCNNYFGSKLELTCEDFAAFWQGRPKAKALTPDLCPHGEPGQCEECAEEYREMISDQYPEYYAGLF